MRVYGSKRFDAIACRYGCCTTKFGNKKNGRKILDRGRRSRARRLARVFIADQLRDPDGR